MATPGLLAGALRLWDGLSDVMDSKRVMRVTRLAVFATFGFLYFLDGRLDRIEASVDPIPAMKVARDKEIADLRFKDQRFDDAIATRDTILKAHADILASLNRNFNALDLAVAQLKGQTEILAREVMRRNHAEATPDRYYIRPGEKP